MTPGADPAQIDKLTERLEDVQRLLSAVAWSIAWSAGEHDPEWNARCLQVIDLLMQVGLSQGLSAQRLEAEPQCRAAASGHQHERRRRERIMRASSSCSSRGKPGMSAFSSR